MQVESKSVLQSVYRALESLNQTLPADRRLDRSPDTLLHESLDSLGLVNLIVETEMAIEEEFGVAVNLADQKAAANGADIYSSVATFATYIESLLAQQ